jgi:hypothetical protein
MSWLYSQALVVAFSEATSSDGARSALSNGSPTPRAFLPPDRTTAFSRPSRFGMTFGPLTDDLGAELLTWFLAASRARTSALPAKAQASTESEAECGATWRGSLARFDPDSRSWRTAQRSLLGDSGEVSVTWPNSGMTVDGQCWELPMSELPTSGTAFGWLLPTPCAWDMANRAETKNQYVTETGTVRRRNPDGSSSNLGLAASIHRWPTPVSRMWKDAGHPSEFRRNEVPLAAQVGGALNPTWVEWLMGWPLGWTDLRPSATDRCHCAPQQPGDFSAPESDARADQGRVSEAAEAN